MPSRAVLEESKIGSRGVTAAFGTFPSHDRRNFPGRKRPMQQFGGDPEFDQGFQKRGRFDGPEEELSVPPATLRILVRQHDAGGIIGKARDPQSSPFYAIYSIFLLLAGRREYQATSQTGTVVVCPVCCCLCICQWLCRSGMWSSVRCTV